MPRGVYKRKGAKHRLTTAEKRWTTKPVELPDAVVSEVQRLQDENARLRERVRKLETALVDALI